MSHVRTEADRKRIKRQHQIDLRFLEAICDIEAKFELTNDEVIGVLARMLDDRTKRLQRRG